MEHTTNTPKITFKNDERSAVLGTAVLVDGKAVGRVRKAERGGRWGYMGHAGGVYCQPIYATRAKAADMLVKHAAADAARRAAR